MSGPEKEIVAASPELPRDEKGEPVFFEPWQAKAFAITLALHEKGVFTWAEWAAALARACAGGAATCSGSTAEHAEAYFTAWLRALEDLLAARRLLSAESVAETARAWQRAAETTPHGKPICLSSPGRARPGGGCRAAGDDGAPAGKVAEHRQGAERTDAGRRGVTRPPGQDMHRRSS